MVCCVVYFLPIGDKRFLIMAVLLGIVLPVALLMELKFAPHSESWAGPFPDLLSCVLLVHVVPEYWHEMMVIGLMVALAPSISASRHAHRVYGLMGAILIVGMSFAGWYHQLHDWMLTVLAVSVVYPALLVYARAQARLAGSASQRVETLKNFHQVAGGVAHSLNNSLMSASGNLELALESFSGPEDVRKSLESALESAKRAGNVARQMASFSGRSVERRIGFDAAAELELIISMMDFVLPERVQASLVIDGELPELEGNRTELQQLFVHLIYQTADSVVAPGEVRVNCSLQENNHLLVEIHNAVSSFWDYRLCSEFQFSGEHRRNIEFCLDVLEEHGGVLKTSSDDDGGCAFLVELPGHEPATRVPDRRNRSAPEQVENRFVIVIDDDDSVRQLLATFLGQLKCKVYTASSGAEGLALLNEHQNEIDRIFLDLKMPGMDGWECFSKIRQQYPDLEVTICSGYTPVAFNRDLQDQHLSFLQKPFDMDALRRTF